MARGSIVLTLLGVVTGCASAPGATVAQLDRRATLNLGCHPSYLQRSRIDSRTVLVQGCQRRVVYVESCQRIRGAHRCTWTADSPWVYAPTIQVTTPTTPAPAPAVAPTPPSSAPVTPADDGMLDVVAVGESCEVTIDGRDFGSTPVTGVEVASGPTAVTCTDGDRSQTRTVWIDPGDTTRLRFNLSPTSRRHRDYGF